MQIALTLTQVTTPGLIVAVVVWLLKDAIKDKDAWWRLLVILTTLVILAVLAQADLVHFLPHHVIHVEPGIWPGIRKH